MKSFFTTAILTYFVYAGAQTACQVTTNAIVTGIAVACSTMTVGLHAIPCAVGATSLATLANSYCTGTINKRRNLNDTRIEHGKATSNDIHARCSNFGPEYGYACIEPRHVKKLGDFTIETNHCKKILFFDSKASKCIGDKFLSYCENGEVKADMCKIGFECQYTKSGKAGCVSI